MKKRREETLAQAPEEDIAILTEIRAAESALVASEAVTEEARKAAEAARERVAEREGKTAKEQAYMQLLRELIDIIDTTPAGSETTDALLQHKDITSAYVIRSRYAMQWSYETSKKFPTNALDLGRLCREAVRGKRGRSCRIGGVSIPSGGTYPGAVDISR